jgi:Ser/Thr protein kinase RdoA (MazF antagonist)
VDAIAGARGAAKHELLRTLGRAVGALHAAGFVHGDLVPSNVQLRDGAVAFLDHDRTRRGQLLVWWGARRNLVQLGRFVVAGVTSSDRARVLSAYADRRGLSRRARRRLARWVAAKVVARRIAIDRIPAAVAADAGHARLMRSGGPFDPARRGVEERP